MTQATPATELVTLSIDGKEVTVPKGTNLIEAAKTIGVEIPHYCYHPDLSIAGNCRMCQVKIEGAPKMEIACNCAVKAGMKVSTHHTSKDVADTQAATLEFLLINHPLDCTICDQAGHCKLQDYHFQYNAKPSRFLEEKEHKPKAVPLGPTVMLDAERCIQCTRCVRFCDEITKTSELGMLNRGDRSTIAVNPGRELDNPFSGTVVDLCPVGALTHSNWRFNTRIWFTQQVDSICPGCSTGCNVKIATRDREVVHVKARYNSNVNKEWLCDQGRYGLAAYAPKERLQYPTVRGKKVAWDIALNTFENLFKSESLAVIAAPDLTLEEYSLLGNLLAKTSKSAIKAVAYRERKLSTLEAKLISPDFAPNFRGAEFGNFVDGNLLAQYESTLSKIRQGEVKALLLVGERSICPEDLDDNLLAAIKSLDESIAMIASSASKLVSVVGTVLPSRSLLEKSGILINRGARAQYFQRCFDPVVGSEPEWRILTRVSNLLGYPLAEPESERELTQKFLQTEDLLKGQSIAALKKGGIAIDPISRGPL